MRNLFACLVHENEHCVVDLVRNLRYCDPDSEILLYNGGGDRALLDRAPCLEHLGAIVHPQPRELRWGRLHEFALDSMRFALGRLPFDTLTVVDSDQLAVRADYSRRLAELVAGESNVGLLGSARGRQPPKSRMGPVRAAYRELDLWRPFLQRFPAGEERFVHWTFWPATVFTAGAAEELVRFYDGDEQLREILGRSRIWATEEVVLPTLVALLGFRVEPSPMSYDYVRYRVRYTRQQLDRALRRDDVFWVHPVPRSYDDPLRTSIRGRLHEYHGALPGEDARAAPAEDCRLLLTEPILRRMRSIQGWLEEDEADLLLAAAAQALRELPAPHVLVEVGSYHGRSTVVLASVAERLDREAKVYAVDPHDGQLGAFGQGVEAGPSSFEHLERNLETSGLAASVEIVLQRSYEVVWERPISFFFVDALHDYPSVSRDFLHFEPWILDGGYVAFHDYASYWPGVRAFVDELLSLGGYERVEHVRSLIVLRKSSWSAPRLALTAGAGQGAEREDRLLPALRPAAASPRSLPAPASEAPLVSCIMPTRDRRSFVPSAVDCFLRQDYPHLELLVVDDGDVAVADLLPREPRVRYLRLDSTLTVGEKRNLACREAAGEIVVHWDDDDWSAPWRVGYQAGSLLESGAQVNGLDRVLFYEPGADRAWWYVFRQRRRTRWLCGATLCYRKALWRRHPFDPVNDGEDGRFLQWIGKGELTALPRQAFYVATIHPGNTCHRRVGRRRWHPCTVRQVHELIGERQIAAWTGPKPTRNP